MLALPSAAAAAAETRTEAAAPAVSLEDERARLVRLCARLTGDLDAAEDLSQETLLTAYRRREHLRRADRRAQWLSGIARNLCLHWLRSRGRERRWTQTAATESAGADATGTAADLDEPDQVPSGFDLELELERSELATLLDRAMALLPPDTRRALVERYVENSSRARAALRLGLSEGAVAMRLARGRVALRRILTTDLREEAAAYGLVDPDREAWQPTRIWCTVCGERRLWGRFGPGNYFHLACRGCFGRREQCMTEARFGPLLDGVKGFKSAYNRVLNKFHEQFRHGIAGRLVSCPRCGTGSPLHASPPSKAGPASAFGYREIRRTCPHCGPVSGPGSLAGLASATPEGRRFAREQGRVRSLPQREIEVGGGPALVAPLESVTGSARLEVVFLRYTLEIAGIYDESRTPVSAVPTPSIG